MRLTAEQASLELARVQEERRRRKVARLQGSLADFVREAWDVIEPGTPLVWNWHIKAVCDKVQALLEGKLPGGKRNLIINVPPGSMKSTIVSVCAPAWMWSRNPAWRGLFAAGSQHLALRDSMKCRDILESQWFQSTFRPVWRFKDDQNAKEFYKNNASGFRRAFSSGSSVTGDRGDGIFVDDPLDAKKVFSKAHRDEIKDWWDRAFANRLNDPKTGTRCIIMQRLHEEDLVGHILAKQPKLWDTLILRQEFEADRDDNPPEDTRTKQGELLFPERFPEDILEEERIRMGSMVYAGQHQQRPAPAEGSIFKLKWFQTYSLDPLAQAGQCLRIVQSWDFAAKAGQENDFTVCTTWGLTKNAYYLLDLWRGKVEFPEAKRQVRALAAKWKPAAILVEDASAGIQILQELRRETRLPLVPVKPPTQDKVARANLVSPTVEAGRVFLPEDAPWLADYLASMTSFPNAKNDDDVDTSTQVFAWANTQNTPSGLRLTGEREMSRLNY